MAMATASGSTQIPGRCPTASHRVENSGAGVEKARFTNAMLTRAPVAFGDVVAGLEHFAIVSYAAGGWRPARSL